MPTSTSHLDDNERLARRLAGARLGWYVHAGVYVVMTAVMGMLSALSAKSWALIPAFAWGVGVAVHGLVVFLLTDGRGLYERLVQQERERLALHRDPW
jgi:hypothetical protein